jgi:hypothetical protein
MVLKHKALDSFAEADPEKDYNMKPKHLLNKSSNKTTTCKKQRQNLT